MADFINTVDVLGDSTVLDSIIDGTIAEFRDKNIKTIGDGAFRECTALETVCFPNATAIRVGAFRGSGLKAITPETFPKVTRLEYMYGSRVFGESGLETVEWPSLVENNESWLFENCTSLRSVSLPNLSNIGTQGRVAFSGCSSLTDVNLPFVTSADFSNCVSLERITLPSVQETGGGIFNNCTKLKVIDLPSCTTINGGHSHFINCPIKALVLRSTTMCTLDLYTYNVDHSAYSFKNSGIANGTGHIYVPRDLVGSYKAATGWSVYGDQFRALEDYTVDGTITGALDEDKI